AKDQMQVNNLPTSPADLQKWLDDQITENAPVIAEQFSQQAVEMAPSVRLTVENYAVGQMGLLVDQGTAFTAEQFSEMVSLKLSRTSEPALIPAPAPKPEEGAPPSDDAAEE
ncbi:MAG: hypothetical protein VX715_06655, partial [Planctomycetota bacterium]|nr:hypothetical protein [Planctomycetota bacterium]